LARYVCDANILVAAFVPEEESPLAERLIERIRIGEIRALAPQQALAEVGHALRLSMLRKRIPRDMVPLLWQDFRSVPVEYVALDGVADHALALSIEHMASYYDSLYVALAIKESAPFLTLDARCVKAFSRLGEVVMRLGESQVA
jgi:predicted nucleic acid-binding protein